MVDQNGLQRVESIPTEVSFSEDCSRLNTSESTDQFDVDLNNQSTVPDYLKNTYYWSYLNPRNVKWLDKEPIVKMILWGQHNKLRQAAFTTIEPGTSVLQVAAVYGRFSCVLADHIGSQGKLKVIDVAPIQVKHTKTKMAEFKHVLVKHGDASCFNHQPYDTVLCYFLLHEIPDEYKTKVLDNLLKHLKPNGQLVIVDYHKPHWAHPIKPITHLVFKFLEPFAIALWRKPIQDFASEATHYQWQQSTFFGGLFQKVVVTKNSIKGEPNKAKHNDK